MAWELQQHMHSWVAPSVHKAASEHEDPHEWLALRHADQRWDSDTGTEGYNKLAEYARSHLSYDVLVRDIADHAVEYSTTTNGGWEVYLEEWTTVPWCTEDDMLSWYA